MSRAIILALALTLGACAISKPAPLPACDGDLVPINTNQRAAR